MKNERRKSIRFFVEDKAFVSIGIRNPKIGKIGDISIRGLSFEYLTSYGKDKKSGEDSEGTANAMIFLLGEKFCLMNLPCRVVYDVMKYVLNCSPVIRKRCGICFGELTEEQMEVLGSFLADHTTGPAPRWGSKKAGKKSANLFQEKKKGE